MISPKHNSVFKKITKKAVYFLVLFNLLFSLVSPALVVPIPVVLSDFKISRAQIKELVFKLLLADEAKAQEVGAPGDIGLAPGAPGAAEVTAAGGGLPVVDTSGNILKGIGNALQKSLHGLKIAFDKAQQGLKDAFFTAANESLRNFLNTIAYDTATWLASGGKGQQPLFYTQGWGEYLKDLADSAAGNFIERLGGDWLDFNVCNPSLPSLKRKIGLGLAQIKRPRRPDCSVTEMVKNWDQAIQDPDFLPKFSEIFDPYRNDIGISFSIFEQYNAEKQAAITEGTKDREEGGGFKGIVDAISGIIKTPANLVKEWATEALVKKSYEPSLHQIQYGPILAEAIGVFVDTLTGKLFEKIFKQGLVSAKDDNFDTSSLGSFGLGFLRDFLSARRPGQNDLYSESAIAGIAARNAAQVRFLDFLQSGKKQNEPYDILSKLAFCPDPQNPGPEECVITPSFRTAIERGLTLKQAIAQGFINGDAPFGQLTYNAAAIYQGIPYRSIVILRTHRIVPATWEIAARAVQLYDNNKILSLNDLIAEYDQADSKYQGLIDQNWVLVVPEHLCKAEGFGEKILYEEAVAGNDANLDGDYNDPDDVQPRRLIGRAEYCADFQTCLEKNPDGTCRYYGYCNEEKRIWDLAGQSCPTQFNTCTTFQSGRGEIASFLKNTLDYNNCNADNAGCQWYCQAFNPINDIWTCTNQDERVLKPCLQANGCDLSASCEIAAGGSACSDPVAVVNLAINQPCGEGSKWWVGDKCVVNAACEIPQNGVSCTTNSCSALPNLLTNNGFEAGNGINATGWIGDNSFFKRVSRNLNDKVQSGNFSLRFYNAGAVISPQTIISNAITLTAGKTYTFTGFVFNKLNSGTIKISIGDGSKIVSDQVKNDWQEVSFDFEVSGNQPVAIAVSGNVVSGSAWFDDFRVSENCVTNAVTLTLIGTIDQDQSKLHFDRDVVECDQSAAGCSQFIRTRPNLGINLIPNGGFEILDESVFDQAKAWQLSINQASATSTADQIHGGAKAVGIEIINHGSDYTYSFNRENFLTLKAGKKYILSAYVYATYPIPAYVNNFYETGGGESRDDYDGTELNLNQRTNQWIRLQKIFTPTEDRYNVSPQLVIGGNVISDGNQGVIYVDDFQLEEVMPDVFFPTNYKEYGSVNLTYLKKPPAYLNCEPQDTNQSGVIGDCIGQAPNEICDLPVPSECGNYVGICQPEEVGCEAYRPVRGGETIPGVVAFDDYCPAECIGYEAFKQSSTAFETQEPLAYFIPQTARQCQAAAVGCDEFTNLDEVAAGGEGKAYYQLLRLCKKPDDVNANCQNFYNWQGSDDTGYQLRVYSLSADTFGQPNQAIADSARWPSVWGTPEDCNSADDLATNPFCKEFYGLDGSISYQILENTISCSADCHPYRKTRLGETDDEARNNCKNTNPDWPTDINGVLIDNPPTNPVWQGGACIYQAVPQEGLACAPAAAGCREYRGNASGNIFTAFADNFEDGEISGWRHGYISNEALSVAGHSIKSQDVSGGRRIASTWADLGSVCRENSASYDPVLFKCAATDLAATTLQTCLVNLGEQYCGLINNVLQSQKTYLMSFWAKSNSANIIEDVTIEIAEDTPSHSINIGTTDLTSEWRYYLFGPFVYDYNDGTQAPWTSSRLRIIAPAEATADFYVDNIKIQEITNYNYVIKNSWTTPVSCDTNPFVTPAISAPQFMLGCKQYRDSTNRVHNLKSFNHLCRLEAVGCEALIDTFNSASPFSQTFNDGDTTGNISLPDDKLVYLTNRLEFSCQSSEKGCQALGLPAIDVDDNVAAYQTTYLVNNPDNYSQILCASPEVGCQEWQTQTGFIYFKDPGPKTCEYKSGQNIVTGWYKTGSTSGQPDCPVLQPPLGEIHPNSGFAGLCPEEFNSCTQFVDPISEQAKNLIFNFDFSLDVDENQKPDGWDITEDLANNITIWSQPLEKLKRNTLYTLSFVSQDKPTTGLAASLIGCSITSFDNSYPLQGYGTDQREIPNLTDERQYSGRFLVGDNAACTLQLSASQNIPNLIKEIAIKETGLYYDLENTVDQTSCNGLVNPEIGCVLFNDRSAVNYKLGEDDISYLTFDADVSGSTVNSGLAVTSCAGNCDSNTILKVMPDRTCESFLYCNTMATIKKDDGTETNYCASIGECNNLAADGSCANPIVVKTSDAPKDYYDSVEEVKNLSGYSNAGVRLKTGDIIPSLFPYAQMTEEGGATRIANGSFEFNFGGTSEPVGWQSIIIGYCTNNLSGDYNPPTTGLRTCTLDRNCSSGETCRLPDSPSEWFNYKFKIEKDIRNLIEGTGYLRLNSFYQAQSEEIDVESGATYVLSGLINTLYLEHPIQTPEARILFLFLDASNNVIPTITCPIVDDGWLQCAELSKIRGLGWQRITKEFQAPTGAKKMVVRLSNFVNDPVCIGAKRYDKNSGCELGGYSLFDDISLKPVLKAKTPRLNQTDFISRSCRLYPTIDALACNFVRDGSIYFGQHGYCVTPDPANPGQCLQWWPVDQVSGETLDDIVAGYNDRVPLDYCTEKDRQNIRVSEGGVLATFGGSSKGDFQIIDDLGRSHEFTKFTINNDYRALFRYPYVEKFKFRGAGIGVANFTGTPFVLLPFSFTMYKDHVCFNIFDFNGGPLEFLLGGGSRLSTKSISSSSDSVDSTFGTLSDFVSGFLGNNQVGCAQNEGIRLPKDTFLITDWGEDKDGDGVFELIDKEQWGGWAAIPMGISLGDFGIAVALPIPYSLANSPAASIINSVLDQLGAPNDFGFGPPLSAKIVTDQEINLTEASTDPIPDMGGDILGISWNIGQADQYVMGALLTGSIVSEVGIQYCTELVRTVTSSGTNKGYANRLSQGSGYILEDVVNKDFKENTTGDFTTNKDDFVKYRYYEPFNFLDLLADPMNYQPSDYQPFGSLVSPQNAQYPTAWDAKASQYNQPLLYEPPRSVFPAPHQARMGEIHTTEGLKNLFARSYGIWHWESRNPDKLTDGGQYKIGPLEDGAATQLWDLPSTQCVSDTRGADEYCLVLPQIPSDNIKINDSASVTLENGVGLVKLSFTTKVDPDQLPITSYSINWGDGKTNTVSGVVLRNRNNPENPFILYHLYDYWQMKAVSTGGNCTDTACTATIKITVKDNWDAEVEVSADNAVTVIR